MGSEKIVFHFFKTGKTSISTACVHLRKRAFLKCPLLLTDLKTLSDCHTGRFFRLESLGTIRHCSLDSCELSISAILVSAPDLSFHYYHILHWFTLSNIDEEKKPVVHIPFVFCYPCYLCFSCCIFSLSHLFVLFSVFLFSLVCPLFFFCFFFFFFAAAQCPNI